MTYEETTEYLFNSAPLFQNIGQGAYKEGLENTYLLDEHFGHPHHKFRTIHIAGTNGKGSCSHTLAAILQCAGYKVGLYTSPHLVDFRERIRINGKTISKQEVIDFVAEHRSFFEPLHPSFFELTTAMAFNYFAKQEVDVAVVEVGLGGRLDCTNIITPDLSIITNISFDHIQFLGDTLAKIAREKAGIIKTDVPVVIGETNSETRLVFQTKADEVGAAISFAEDSPQLLSQETTQEGHSRYQTVDYGLLEGELGGLCQEKNARTILCALPILHSQGYHFKEKDVRNGFANVCELTGLMGRWQTLRRDPQLVCDTGHNVGGMQYIVAQLNQQKFSTLRIVLGMVNDKDISGVLKMLPKDAVYYFTKASVKRALDEKEIQKLANKNGLKGTSFPCVKNAVDAALSDAEKNDFIFVGGSSFIVADLLCHMQPSKS